MNSKFLLAVIVGMVILLGYYIYGMFLSNQSVERNLNVDVALVDQVAKNFTAYSDHFSALAKDAGGVYAFTVLEAASLPPNIDTHLLGHVVGDELYNQEGLDGMQHCTHDFRNACSHSIVIGALLERGTVVLDEVNEVCQKAPGGSGAYTMCFHGFGHGVLAYTEYELPEAVELCREVGTAQYNNEEFKQCVGGAIMEMRGGIHDPLIWEQNGKKYLSDEDPLGLCTAAYMPEEAKHFCYTYITPFIFDAVGMQDGPITDTALRRSFEFCAAAETAYRDTCYEGIGKELIVLVQDRDIRSVDDITDAQLNQVIDWCQLGGTTDVITSCLTEVLDSLFWGGENDPQASVRFCRLIEDATIQTSCYEKYLVNVESYVPLDKRPQFCSSIPNTYQGQCMGE